MNIDIHGELTEVKWIRIRRVARAVDFFALVNGKWVHFAKMRNKKIPTYRQVQWPNPERMYGWSEPYRLPEE